MTKTPYQILQKPLITEKAMDQKEHNRTLAFRVAADANKVEIRQAVEVLFKVKVESVRTAVFHGKERRRGRNVGSRPDWKKALVKLKAGQKMPEFVENV
jgi:large subunit ribosomal protein L23